MKNKKLMIVSILVIALVLLMSSYVKATGNTPIIDMNNLVVDNNDITNEPTGNSATDPLPIQNVGGENNSTNNENVNKANETLPQTGVAGDTTLFIFIAICIGSAIYAYLKIRKYNNIH